MWSTSFEAIQGSFDTLEAGVARGWALSGDGPLLVDVLIDGKKAGAFVADLRRDDLIAHGLGDCGFAFTIPARFWDQKQHELAFIAGGAGAEAPFFETTFFVTEDDQFYPDADSLKSETVSKYLDLTFYSEAADEKFVNIEAAIDHYLSNGCYKGIAPNAYFDPKGYVSSCDRDVGLSGALFDYAQRGWRKGIAPSDYFDAASYLKENPDVVLNAFEPLSHYLLFGRHEGRGQTAVKPIPSTQSKEVRPSEFFNAPSLEVFTEPTSIKLNTGLSRHFKEYDAKRIRFAFLIPDFAPGAGGHMAIFKMVYWLETLGHSCEIWINYPNVRSNSLDVKNDIIKYFQPVKASVRLLEPTSTIKSDILVVTDTGTVWSSRKHADVGATIYLVQDFEPFFFAKGAQYILAEQTYSFGLPALCSSPWLEKKMQGYGMEAESFIYPVDADIYYPAKSSKSKAKPTTNTPVRIALYARQFTQRRAVELAVMGLYEFRRRNPDVDFEVHAFGQEYSETTQWPFPVVDHGVMREHELAELFRECDLGVVFSATNYSISTIEMLGSGLPVIEVATESTRETFPENILLMAEPTPSGVREALEAAIRNPEESADRAKKALKWVSGGSWSKIAKQMEKYAITELDKVGWTKKRRARTAKEFTHATVVIPTYNAGADMRRVLDAVSRQKAPWPYDILVIDSSSSDGSTDIVKDYEKAKLVTIPQNEFSHGGTRDRAFDLCSSEYVAYLTQDAIPISDRWLFDLVGGFEGVPGAGVVFGRHEPHDDADAFTQRDLKAHFDMIDNQIPPIVSFLTHRERFDAGDLDWLRAIRFLSDNNSCYKRSVLDHVRFRNIDFGEDQAYAWDALTSGFSRIYQNSAAVKHSHSYSPAEIEKRTRIETGFYMDLFNEDIPPKSSADAKSRLEYLVARDIAYGIKKGLSSHEIWDQLQRNHAIVCGQNLTNVNVPELTDILSKTMLAWLGQSLPS